MEGREGPNRAVLIHMAQIVKPLLSELVFIGGQVTELLITAPGALGPRPTDDVDVIVSATTKAAFNAIEEQLLTLGLQPDRTEDAPICRWIAVGGYKLDVMPLDQEVLGFGSRWYPRVVAQSTSFSLSEELTIRIPTAPLFLATKWEAFTGRGDGDVMGSHDLEDIISLIAGRPEVVEELRSAEYPVQQWVGSQTKAFMNHYDADYAILGALPDASVSPEIAEDVRSRLELIAEMV